jgi:hypothetical protein
LALRAILWRCAPYPAFFGGEAFRESVVLGSNNEKEANLSLLANKTKQKKENTLRTQLSSPFRRPPATGGKKPRI